MADANIVISGVSMTPNPVNTSAKYVISVDIKDKVYVAETGDGSGLSDSDGSLIETE